MTTMAGRHLCMGCGESLGSLLGGLFALSATASTEDGGGLDLRFNEPMKRHTTWQVGGPAERFFRPRNRDELFSFLRALEAETPLFWLGGGSNLLVRDGGIAGVVITTAGALESISLAGDGLVSVEAGASCARLARFCQRSGLGGCEFLAGIPGTLGGALAMNAGAFGSEIWPLVAEVETVDRHGVVRWRPRADFRYGYRQVEMPPGEWFLSARLQLQEASEEARLRVREQLAQRNRSQPMADASAGSVFRNPPGDYAGRLIEACGLKGSRIGNAAVSERHANFIVNLGGAKAADIEALIEAIEAEVLVRFGIPLEREVRIIGRAE